MIASFSTCPECGAAWRTGFRHKCKTPEELAELLADSRQHLRAKTGKKTACGRQVVASTSIVSAALASDCDKCRTVVGVARVSDKYWDGRTVGVRPEPKWTPSPYPNARKLKRR